MDDDPLSERPRSVPLSKTPSWVMLGFVLGALFVLALPRSPAPAPRPVVVAPPAISKPLAIEPQLTVIEAVFNAWGDHAVWDNDTTQVAMWNTGMDEFSDCYEARRVDGVLYFRTLPKLTRRIIRHGKPLPTNCPLQFTETEEQYREWHDEGRYERPPEPRRVVDAPRYDRAAPVPPAVDPVPAVVPPAPSSEKIAPKSSQ
jgi:hypothetical protein